MKDLTLSSRALIMLALSLLLTLHMHLDRLPVWIVAGAVGSLLWRAGIHFGRLASPHWSIKGALVLLGFTGIYLTYGRDLSIESMVALLVAGFVLKPLEVEKRSDSYVLLFLCFLLIGLHFLFEQGPLDYVWVIAILWVILTTQITINQTSIASHENADKRANAAHWQALSLFLKAVPLAVFLFFVLPRLAPLWVLNISTSDGVIGLSDTMSPGQIAQLGKSDELAFRVRFDSAVPPVQDQYWRALVLDYFDGESWRQRYKPSINWNSRNVIEDTSTNSLTEYEVLLQPHDQKWLFSLGVARPKTADIGISEDGRLVSKHTIRSPYQYKVTSDIQAAPQAKPLGGLALNAYLQLPSYGNERSRAFARALKEKIPDVGEFTQALQRFFNGNEFSYTLNPGELNSDSTIDEFLFDSQKGFCAHFAGSLVYLMRSAGVPARVVVGYLGVEENPVANYYSVYQYNAHAWVEVWMEGAGWLKVDPTGWVAPERVEQGLEQAVQRDFVGFSSNLPWLNSMRNQMNAFNYYWNDWMLSYKGGAQQQFLEGFFGKKSELELILLLLGCFFSMLAVGFLFMFMDFKRVQLTHEQKMLGLYKRTLIRSGIHISPSTSLLQMSEQAIKVHPNLSANIANIRTLFEQPLYVNPDSVMTKIQRQHLRKAIRLFAKQLN
jgi:transglutaminase-like putative cysteine protease